LLSVLKLSFFTALKPIYFVATICNPVYFMGCATGVRLIMSRELFITGRGLLAANVKTYLLSL